MNTILVIGCWLSVVGPTNHEKPVTNNPSVRVGVLGEGQLRFAAGRKVAFSLSATLIPNAAGLLADAAGRPVLPQIKVAPGAFKVAMNGTVSVAGRTVGRLVLERAGGDVGFPGEGTFGVLTVGSATSSSYPSKAPIAAATIRPRVSLRGGRIEIDGDRFLLRDVADLDGDPATIARLGTIDLGAVPVVGIRRGLTLWAMRSAVRNAGFKEGSVDLDVPPDSTVARKGQTVAVDAIVDEATKAAKLAIGTDDVSLGAGPAILPLTVVSGDLTFRTVARAPQGERLMVDVTALVAGKEVGRRTVAFLAHRDGVRAGDAVRVTITRNGATIETSAKARTGGFVRDTIQVVSADGGVMTATVTGTGAVEVKL